MVGKKSACNAGDPDSIPRLVTSPEKEMATHSSILAWRIPWTEEPGGLQSPGLQSQTRLRTNTLTSLHFGSDGILVTAPCYFL